MIAVTGAGGFLGWHLRVAAFGEDVEPIAVGDRFDLETAVRVLDRADMLIHLAGANRGDDVAALNVQFAQQMRAALDLSPTPVVYAGTIQTAGPYGESKTEAAQILQPDRDLALPNIFGEHGRPFYNSVVATFCHLLATGGAPEVTEDRELTLMHAQDAADWLLGAAPPVYRSASVSQVLEILREFAETYPAQMPNIDDPFRRDLFNTYRSFLTPSPIELTRHTDSRGSFFEIIRSGTGQSSFSSTVPGVTRGDHFHRRKIERFTVLSGEATIAMRRLFSDEVLSFDVTGEQPQAVDMPTGWTHNITNTGEGDLLTSFWINEHFDPAHPDTTLEAV